MFVKESIIVQLCFASLRQMVTNGTVKTHAFEAFEKKIITLLLDRISALVSTLHYIAGF